ncbi:MAG: fucose isomerase, partial [Planctomycetota bacterium]|nr:fucose isomerase [Planctomycetota bacterium]
MQTLVNVPQVKLGVVGVSRDCFPASLTKARLAKMAGFLRDRKVPVHICKTIVENEGDALAALKELADGGANALFVFLGNFGPEGPTTLLMQRFPGPCMAAAAAEENKRVLMTDRGDALCGLLNNSYNQKLRGLRAHIPGYPVGLPDALAEHAAGFIDIARVVIGLRNLKVVSFGPRPQDFLACNAPIGPLYSLGVEVQENSELDLLLAYQKAAGDAKAIKRIVAEMERELRGKNTYPDLLPKLAQLEAALLGWRERNAGASQFVVFANKCWPAFEPAFGFVPCYVNSRLAGKGIPVACEVDLYGAVSEYMATCATLEPATLLDINNSVPSDVVGGNVDLRGAARGDLFMGFHCGNTCSSHLCGDAALKYQLIMNRGLENGGPPDITRGTLE